MTSHGMWIGPVFFGIAAWFVFGAPSSAADDTPVRSIPRPDTAPRRQIIGDPPMIEINGFDRVCTDCHGIFPLGDGRGDRERMQHPDVELQHGINDNCRNCHDAENMNGLVLRTGEKITYTEVPRLCRSCHGPTYRDWERGIHGRTNDYWNAELGEPRKLKCIECHDPHDPRRPAMDPLEPLPGPRMDPRTHEEPVHLPEETDPLRRALHTQRKDH